MFSRIILIVLKQILKRIYIMNTKKIFSLAFRQEYFKGYSNGINPFLQTNCNSNSEAFAFGFTSGRIDYEEMNGTIKEGIPQRIVTKKVLEEFLLSGLLGLSFDTEGYTMHQINLISIWYQSGIEKYEPNQSIYLFKILEENGIQLR